MLKFKEIDIDWYQYNKINNLKSFQGTKDKIWMIILTSTPLSLPSIQTHW